MAVNLNIDTELLEAALKIDGLKSKEDIVNQALSEFTKRVKRLNLNNLTTHTSLTYNKYTKKRWRCTYDKDTRCFYWRHNWFG